MWYHYIFVLVGLYFIAVGIYNAYMMAGNNLDGVILNSVIAVLGTGLVGFGWHGVIYSKGFMMAAKDAIKDSISQPRRDRDWQPRAPTGGRR